jgi:hypothetical protein
MVTNKLNLPQSLVNFANSRDKHEYVNNRYSITELLSPTREIQLSRLHADEIQEDVSDMVMALFGTAAHKVLEDNYDEKTEVKFEVQIGEDTIVGISDLITTDAIEDYKFTSVSKIMRNDFSDWRDQGLGYAWLNYLKTGDIKRKLKFHAFMRDWSKLKSNAINNYPQSPIYTWEYDIQDSDYDYIEQKIKNKIKDIKENKNPVCTNEEKWYTGDKYAVYKKAGDKRAAIVLDNEQEAHEYITNKCGGVSEIEVRKGECLKCKYYCKVSKWCYGGN